MAEQENSPGLVVDQKMMDVLVTNVIPTSRYFEIRFDHMDEKFNRLNSDLLEFKHEVNKRFEQVDNRFINLKQEMDKRFEQIDKRFEQVDKRFEQMNTKLDKVLERIDVKIDAGLRENRMITIRLFSFTILFSAISVTGIFAKMFHLF